MRVTPMLSMESTCGCFAQSGRVSTVMPTLRVLLVSALVFASSKLADGFCVIASRQRWMNHVWYSIGVAGKVPPMMINSILSTLCPMAVNWSIRL